jgi:hypothetical protein
VRELENVLRRGVIDKPADAYVLHAADLDLADVSAEPDDGAAASGRPRVMFYDERIARTRSSTTGKRFSGVPTWEPARAGDGTLLDEAFGRAFPLGGEGEGRQEPASALRGAQGRLTRSTRAPRRRS